jgi:hypothetical protein
MVPFMTLSKEAITRSVFDRLELPKAASAKAVEATLQSSNFYHIFHRSHFMEMCTGCASYWEKMQKAGSSKVEVVRKFGYTSQRSK